METTQIAEHPAPAPLYNPDELARIVSVLRHCTEPEEIILFGSLAGAVPFSRVAAYDLLVLTQNRTEKDWARIDRYLKLEISLGTIPHINLYLCPVRIQHGDGIGRFYRMVRFEGRTVYSRRKIRERTFDYEPVYFDANDLYEHYFSQAEGLLEAADQGLIVFDMRRVAFCTAYAVELLLHALYAAHHASDTALHNLPELFLRLRTLSPELYLLLDPEQSGASRMLTRLEECRTTTLYTPHCPVDHDEIEKYSDRTAQLKELIEKLSTARLEHYKSRNDAAD